MSKKDIHQQAHDAFKAWMKISDKVEAALTDDAVSVEEYKSLQEQWDTAGENFARLQGESLKEATAKRDELRKEGFA